MKSARVTSIDALSRFKAAYAEFGELARVSLTSAESNVHRMLGWLQSQQKQWQMTLRKRERKLAEAKTELIRAEMSSRDERPSCFMERKAVEKAKRAVQEAQWKIDRCRHWHKQIDREMLLFKGQLQGLSSRIDRDVPRGLVRLTQLMDHLDKYVRLAAPDATPQPGPREDSDTAAENDA